MHSLCCGQVFCVDCADEREYLHCVPAKLQLTSSSSNSACKCDAGYTGPANSCTACAAGTYKATTGSAACDNCAAGTYSAADASPFCTNCAAGKFSAATAQTSSAACTNCAEGLKSKAGATICTVCENQVWPCGMDCYGPWGGDICYKCPEHTTTAYSGPDANYVHECLCKSGSFHDGPTCTKCAPGKVSSYGDFECGACEAGKYSNAAATACMNCVAGTYSTAASVCTNCPAFSTSLSASTSISSCACNSGYDAFTVGKYDMSGSFSCQASLCNAGYTGPAGSCTACAAGKYKPLSGSEVCTNCVAGTYSGSTAQTSEDTCTNCPAGKFSDVVGATTCFDCPAGKFSKLYTSCTDPFAPEPLNSGMPQQVYLNSGMPHFE